MNERLSGSEDAPHKPSAAGEAAFLIALMTVLMVGFGRSESTVACGMTGSTSGAASGNHYDTLGVAPSATAAQIRRAYLDAARRWHPDRHSSGSESDSRQAEQAMRRVNEAWSVLSQQASREAYDRRLLNTPPPLVDRAGQSPGIHTTEGVTRVDPRLLDPEFLAARRDAQLNEISNRSAVAIRIGPVLAVIGLLVAVFVFTAYADRGDVDQVSPTIAPAPPLGGGIEAFDCVVVTSGPALLEVPCTSPATERVVGAHAAGGSCPPATLRSVTLTNGVTACLASG